MDYCQNINIEKFSINTRSIQCSVNVKVEEPYLEVLGCVESAGLSPAPGPHTEHAGEGAACDLPLLLVLANSKHNAFIKILGY